MAPDSIKREYLIFNLLGLAFIHQVVVGFRLLATSLCGAK